jgi:AraC-like DNA-binding protein
VDRLPPCQPVDRRLLLQTDLLTVRDNVCSREDPSISAETSPLPYHELSIPLAGVWVLRDGSRSTTFCPGTAHLLSRGFTYRAEHPCGCGADRNLGVAISDALLDELGVAERSSVTALDARSVGVVWALRTALLRQTEEPTACEETVLEFISTLLPHSTATDSLPSKATRRAHEELVRRVETVIAQGHTHPLTLACIARRAHTSPYHMCRVFRAHTGQSVGGRLRTARIATALDQLLDNNESLGVIAGNAGFTDGPHLVRAFRTSLGMTPGRFRQAASREILEWANRALAPTRHN